MIQFQNADVCPQAKVAFEAQPSLDVHEAVELVKAAKHIDSAMGILKTAYAVGKLDSGSYDDFLLHIEEASEILESLGVLEDHDYIHSDLEPRAVELLETDDVDVEDEALEFDGWEDHLFGGSDSDD